MHLIQFVEQDLELVQIFRTEEVHSILLKSRVERPSSGSIQPDDHFTRDSVARLLLSDLLDRFK
jgi:hypothetical protein